MKILVFSDSHGRSQEMREAVAKHARNTDAVFFLGDGYLNFVRIRDEFPAIAFYGVLGNCDLAGLFRGEEVFYERIVSLDSYRFLLMHGHKYWVKEGYGRAVEHAKAAGADVLLCGHTHCPLDTTDDGLILFNPGSVGEYTNGRRTYGILEIVNGVLVRSHADLSGDKI